MKSAGAAQTYGVSLENTIGKRIADLKSLLIDLEPLTFSRGQQGARVMPA